MSTRIVYDRLVFYAGDLIFAEGDTGNWAYLIQAGRIEILKRDPTGGERSLAVLGPGRLFGEMALIDEQPRMASARALTNCTLVLIDRDTMLDKVRKSPPLVRELLQNFSINLRALTRRHMEEKATVDGGPRPYVGERVS